MIDAIALLPVLAPARVAAVALAVALSKLPKSQECSLAEIFTTIRQRLRAGAIAEQLGKAARIIEQDPAGFDLVDTPAGRYWVVHGHANLVLVEAAEQQTGIFGGGEYGVHAGDVVLDCGAQLGVYRRTALAAGARLVVAIELAPDNLECLRRNLAAEVRSGRAIIYPKGVWDKDEFLTLNVDPENSAADSVARKHGSSVEGPRAPLTTIDKLAGELRLERVDFIKMNIEGAEQKALAGAQQTLARFRPRLAICTYHLPDDPDRVPPLVRRARGDYRAKCSRCSDYGARVRPEILLFY